MYTEFRSSTSRQSFVYVCHHVWICPTLLQNKVLKGWRTAPKKQRMIRIENKKTQNFMLLTTKRVTTNSSSCGLKMYRWLSTSCGLKMVKTIFQFLWFENGDADFPIIVVWKWWRRFSISGDLKIVTTICQFLQFENCDDDFPVLVVWKCWWFSSFCGLKIVTMIVQFLWYENNDDDYQFHVVRKFSNDYKVHKFFVCVLQVDNHSPCTIKSEHRFCKVRPLSAYVEMFVAMASCPTNMLLDLFHYLSKIQLSFCTPWKI
jgi:hypothetical protein